MYSIYKITFPNNKQYIGMTKYTSMYRAKQHYSRRNNCCCVCDGFKFYKLDEVKVEYLRMYECKQTALYVEGELIVREKTYVPYGYNNSAQFAGKYLQKIGQLNDS